MAADDLEIWTLRTSISTENRASITCTTPPAIAPAAQPF
jgi:hypothetical protein